MDSFSVRGTYILISLEILSTFYESMASWLNFYFMILKSELNFQKVSKSIIFDYGVRLNNKALC